MVFAIPKKLAFGGLEVAIAQKQKSRHRGYSAKIDLSVWYVYPRWAFKAKVGKEDEAARGSEIKQQEAVRQSRENITRIGPMGSLRLLQKVCFYPHGDFKAKVATCINRRLGCRGNGSSWANSGGSILLIILGAFWIFRCFKTSWVILVCYMPAESLVKIIREYA